MSYVIIVQAVVRIVRMVSIPVQMEITMMYDYGFRIAINFFDESNSSRTMLIKSR